MLSISAIIPETGTRIEAIGTPLLSPYPIVEEEK
jgi:hypothetical protein